MSAVYKQWQEGLIGPEQALRALVSDLGEVESDYTLYAAQREALRAELSQVVDALGGKAEVAGFGRLEITSPVKTASYDRKALDDLVIDLTQAGLGEVAQRIARCRTQSARAGGLRITREKA